MSTYSKALRHARHAAALAALTIALIAGSSRVAAAQSNESGSDNGLVGTWIVEVTLRNCDTGAPMGPPFSSLVTFHRGGTISESAGSSSFAPGQRSSGHGIWSQEKGQTYSQKMIAAILFDTPPNLPVSPGFFAGWSTITHTVEFVNADQISSSGTNAFYKMDGTQYRAGCSTSVGRRFK